MKELSTAEKFWLTSIEEDSRNQFNRAITQILQDRGEDITKEWEIKRNEKGIVIGFEERQKEGQ